MEVGYCLILKVISAITGLSLQLQKIYMKNRPQSHPLPAVGEDGGEGAQDAEVHPLPAPPLEGEEKL
jgi:hypothetical protein